MISKNKIFKEVSWSFATKVVVFVLFFLLNAYLTRKLGIEGFGRWSYFYSFVNIIALVSYFGINASSRKYAAQYNKKRKINNVIYSSLKLRIIFSFIFSILVAIFHAQLANILGMEELTQLFLLAAPLIFFMGLIDFSKQIFTGLHRIKYTFLVSFLDFFLKLVLVVSFFYFAVTLSNIVYSFVLASAFSSLIGIWFLYKRFWKGITEKKDLTSKIFKYSLPLFVTGIGFLIATELDTLMLGILSSDYEVGRYALAKKIVQKLPHISTALAMGAMPVFAKLNSSNKEKLKKLFDKLLKTNALIFIPISIGIIFLGKIFVPLVFGEDFIASVLPLQILTIYLLSFSFSIFLSSFLDYRGLAKKRARNMIVSIVLNIILNLVLIPKYGAIGTAIATSASYLPYLILNWIEAKEEMSSIEKTNRKK